MNKILLDYSALKALLVKEDPNNELIIKMIKNIDNIYTFYVPYHIFIKSMNLCKEYDSKIKDEIYFILNNATRIHHLTNMDVYNRSLRRYIKYDKLSYDDCLTIEFMKDKEIRHILSFNENLDNVKDINRVYSFSRNNKKHLNF